MKRHKDFPKLFIFCATLLCFLAMQHLIYTDATASNTASNLDSLRERILCANIEYVVGTVVAQEENRFGANGLLPVSEARNLSNAATATNDATPDVSTTTNDASPENTTATNRPSRTTPSHPYLYQTKHCSYDYDALTTTNSLRALLANRSSDGRSSDGLGNALPPPASVAALTNPSRLLTHHGAGITLLSLLNQTAIFPIFSSQLVVMTIVVQALCAVILAFVIGWIYREISRIAGFVVLVCTLLSPVMLYASAQLVIPLAALLLPFATLSWLLYFHKRDLLTNTNAVWIIYAVTTFISLVFAGYSFILPAVCSAFAPVLYYCCIKKQPLIASSKDIGAFAIASISAVVASLLLLSAQAWVAHRSFEGVVALFRHLFQALAVASFATPPQLPQSLAVSHIIPLTQVLTRYGTAPAITATLHFPFVPITISYLQLCIAFAVLIIATLIIQNAYAHGSRLIRYRPLLQYKLFVVGITAAYLLLIPLITIAVFPAFSWRALPHALIQWHLAAVPLCITFIVYFCMRLLMSWMRKQQP